MINKPQKNGWLLENVLGLMHCIVYWIMHLNFALCLLAGLAGCFCFHVLSFPFSSFHLISFPFSSFHLMPCPLRDEMDQYLNVDQWQKKSKKESKEEDEKDS